MTSNTQLIVIIFTAVLSLASSLIGGLVLVNLRSIGERQTRSEDKHAELEKRVETLASQRLECGKTFVDKVDFIRNVTKSEHALEELIKMVSTMQGSLKAIEQMPQICGSIAREVAAEALKAVKEVQRG